MEVGVGLLHPGVHDIGGQEAGEGVGDFCDRCPGANDGADADGGTWGRQVHLLSVRSQLGIRNRGYSAYCSTKGGMALMIKQHAVELAPHGITVNGVAPTFVYTELIRYIVEDPEYHDAIVSRIPIGRIAEPRDVVSPVLFFCSPGAGFVTGQTLYVDGGITASQ